MKARRLWIGSKPEHCDLCRERLAGVFIDGATQWGPWAMMCPDCHKRLGRGLGTGYGQRYEKDKAGDWLKVEG